jgi:ABC-type transport system involved in cytochrome bd biosynthesis fused ATPase/permease subunit
MKLNQILLGLVAILTFLFYRKSRSLTLIKTEMEVNKHKKVLDSLQGAEDEIIAKRVEASRHYHAALLEYKSAKRKLPRAERLKQRPK